MYNLKHDPQTMQSSIQDIDSFLARLQLPTEQLFSLNIPFSIYDITNVIDSLPRGKTPGPDGFMND